MRMRKKPWAGEMIESRSDCVIAQPQQYAGKWNQLADGRQIHVEIGAGKGDYWIAMAHQYPECLWIAIEKDVDCAAIPLRNHWIIPLRT